MPWANAKHSGLIAEILSQLRETNLSVQKTHRKVRVIFQNVLRPGNSRAPGEKGSIETSSVRLSDAYTENEMEYLLHSSDSVLSPRLRELEENSVGVIWEPESESTIPLRRVISESQSENLAPDIVQGDFQSQIRLEPLPSEISSTSSRDRQIPESQAALERQFKLLLEDRSLILDIESVGRLVLKMQAAARERESKLPHEFGLAVGLEFRCKSFRNVAD